MPTGTTSIQTGFTGTPITGTNGAAGPPQLPDTVTVQYDGTGANDCSNAIVAAGNLVTEAFDLNANNLRCTASGVTSPMVSNVEDLQFFYGIDTSGDESANRYVEVPGNWGQVVSVRVCILIRSEEQGITTAAQSYLNCNGAIGADTNAANDFTTATDSRLRRTFVATFSLRNRIHNQP